MRLFAALAGLVLLDAFAIADSNNSIDGMELVDAKWNLELKPGGQRVQLAGTVQQIYPQLLGLNPTYEADWAVNNQTSVEDDYFVTEDESDGETETPANGLSVRGGKSRINRWYWVIWQNAVPKCNVRTWAQCHDVKKGIEHVYKVKGAPVLEPKKCSQLSCLNKSAVIWCNVSERTQNASFYYLVAKGAWMIYEQCQEKEPAIFKSRGQRCWVRGKVFPWYRNWFVQILAVDSCY